MPDAPLLFDPKALAAHRKRMSDDALFLHRAARDEVQDRLQMVNRSFTSVAVVTPVPAIWREIFPDARFVTDAEVLALEEEAHDLVIHALCLHWANDPVGQLIQCRRALKPDGFFLGLMFGGRTLSGLREALAEAEVQVTGGLSPRVAPMGEIRDLGALLQRAGLALPVADAFDVTAEYRDLLHLMRDLRAMGETNAMAGRLRHPTRRAVFALAAEHYARANPAPKGRVTARFDIVCLTGWAPHESQPQPLRPGSAKSRLADALNAREVPLKD